MYINTYSYVYYIKDDHGRATQVRKSIGVHQQQLCFHFVFVLNAIVPFLAHSLAISSVLGSFLSKTRLRSGFILAVHTRTSIITVVNAFEHIHAAEMHGPYVCMHVCVCTPIFVRLGYIMCTSLMKIHSRTYIHVCIQ